jgi:hypothetical protein
MKLNDMGQRYQSAWLLLPVARDCGTQEIADIAMQFAAPPGATRMTTPQLQTPVGQLKAAPDHARERDRSGLHSRPTVIPVLLPLRQGKRRAFKGFRSSLDASPGDSPSMAGNQDLFTALDSQGAPLLLRRQLLGPSMAVG